MVSLKYQDRTAETCVAIAADSIDAICAYARSDLHKQTERYSSVTYLTGAIIPLICIIVKDNNASVKTTAVDSFRKALLLLQDIASSLTLARRTLQRLRRIIYTANNAINKKQQPNGSYLARETSAARSELYVPPLMNILDWPMSMAEPGGAQIPFDNDSSHLVNNVFDEDLASGLAADMHWFSYDWGSQ